MTSRGETKKLFPTTVHSWVRLHLRSYEGETSKSNSWFKIVDSDSEILTTCDATDAIIFGNISASALFQTRCDSDLRTPLIPGSTSSVPRFCEEEGEEHLCSKDCVPSFRVTNSPRIQRTELWCGMYRDRASEKMRLRLEINE